MLVLVLALEQLEVEVELQETNRVRDPVHRLLLPAWVRLVQRRVRRLRHLGKPRFLQDRRRRPIKRVRLLRI